MTALHSSRFPDLLDLTSPQDSRDRHLIDAVHDHLHGLWENIDCFSAATLRKFYPEMRLHIDEIKAGGKQEGREDDPDVDEASAAAELAQAFATIEEYRNYLPTRFYNDFADWLITFLSEANWSGDPDLLRSAGPHIVREAIRRHAAKESY